jgi:hypothetical protein
LLCFRRDWASLAELLTEKADWWRKKGWERGKQRMKWMEWVNGMEWMDEWKFVFKQK